MFGCCGKEGVKYINKDGLMDIKRLKDKAAPFNLNGEHGLPKKPCSCPCHKDGSHVFC